MAPNDLAWPTRPTQQLSSPPLITVPATSASFPKTEHAKLILVSEPLCLLPLESSSPGSFHEWSLLSRTKETFLYYFPIKVVLWLCPRPALSLPLIPLPVLVPSLYLSQPESISFIRLSEQCLWRLKWKNSFKAQTCLLHHCFLNTGKNVPEFRNTSNLGRRS